MKNQDWPQGVPLKPPSETVLDLAGIMSTDAREGINKQAKDLHYQARVIVLPRDYRDNDEMGALGKEIGTKWGVTGSHPTDRLLVLIDYTNHHVRIIHGDKLDAAGINSAYIKGYVIPQVFIPRAKQSDFESAISDSLTAVENRYQTSRNASKIDNGQTQSRGAGNAEQSLADLKQSSTQSSSHPVVTHGGASPLAGPALIVVIIIFVSCAITLFWSYKNSRIQKQKVLSKTLESKLNELYITADQLGQASEYVKPEDNKEIAYRIGQYFQRLSTLERAKDEVDKLTSSGKHAASIDGLIKCLQMSDVLLEESKHLNTQVNAITGGIDTQAEGRALIEQKEAEAKGQILKVPEQNSADKLPSRLFGSSRYYQPTWSTMDEYAHPIVVQSGGGLTSLMIMLNQMETNRRLDSMAMHQYNVPSASSYYDDGNNWSNSDSGSWSSSDSGSWGGGSSDSGSWDSGSSDSGSSDSGSW